MQDKFSGSWYIYRIATHEKGGFDLASKFMTDKLSGRTLFNMLEMLDVYDALKEEARNKNKAKNPQP